LKKEVIPETGLVITRRDPCKTDLSYCSIIHVRTQKAGCEQLAGRLDWSCFVQMGLQINVLSNESLVEYIKKELENGGVSAKDIYHEQ
jgi:hypothetical protein